MEEESNSVVTLVFHNHVIVGNILSYLDFTSSKALSCVNQTLKQLIRQNSGVLNRAKFRFFFEDPVNKQRSPKPSAFSLLHFYWKNVCVQLHSGWEKDEFNAILRLVSSIKKLEVHAGWLLGINFEVVLKERLEMFLTLLDTTTELRELTICADVLDALALDEFSEALSKYDNVQANLEKLESLVIKCQNSDQHYSLIYAHGFGPILALLGVMPRALTKFEISRITAFGDNSAADWELAGLQYGVISIFDKYSTSLTSISLEKYMWEASAGVDSLFSPSLKHLSVSAERRHISRVVDFLNRQPLLQSLTLMLGTEEIQCQTLLAPLLRHGPTLRQLTLSWKESSSPVEASRIFYCVKNFRILRQLSLHQGTTKDHGWNTQCSLASALAILPEGLQELNLAGRPVRCAKNQGMYCVQMQLARFHALTKLNLVNCPNILDDQVMGHICSQLKQLIEFGFSQCDGVTDARITVAPGLQALKALRKLEILSCKGLTPETLVDVIKFQELRELTVVCCKALELEFYTTLVKQNKNLEILKISTTEFKRKADLENAITLQSRTFRYLLFTEPLHKTDFRGSQDADYFSVTSDSDD